MDTMEKISENMEDINEPLTKPKKPRSEKQVQSFKIAMEKRAANIAIKKQEKEIKAAELLVKVKKETTPTPAPIEMPKQRHRAKTIVQDSESDEEIIIVKSKPKKKVKKIIIESSESDSDSGSDGGQAPQQQYVQRQLYEAPTFNSNNYFI